MQDEPLRRARSTRSFSSARTTRVPFWAKAGALAAAIAVLVFAGWHYEYGTQRTVTFTVRSLDDQATSKGGHQYLVFTTGGQVFRNTDSWLHGKTDSSSVQAMFQAGDTYRCPVYGFRMFWASSYPDILDGCKQVAGGAK